MWYPILGSSHPTFAMLPHERLDAWKLCNELSPRIDDITDTFPIDEKYRLTSQMRRCVLSAPTNIAEGPGSSW